MNSKKWMTGLEEIIKKAKKNHLIPILMVAAAGILFLLLGNGSLSASKVSQGKEEVGAVYQDQSAEIEKMLRQIPGVNKAYVFVSYEDDGKTEYAYDYKGDISRKEADDIQENTDTQMVITRANGEEHPVVIRRIHPTIKGVTVIAQGDETAELKYKIYDAVKSALGVEAHKIEVIVN